MDSVYVTRLRGGDHREAAALPFSLLPIGSIEYHGDHAPFGTDVTLAEGLARRLAGLRPCLVFPPLAYTFAPRLTRRFGPAVSVHPEPFLGYLSEVLAGVAAFGPRRVLVLNGHSENQYALRLAAETVCEAQPEASVAIVNWWRLAQAVPAEGAEDPWGEGGGHGHGGPLEISVTAALDPEGIRIPHDGRHDIPYEAPWWRSAAQVVGRGQAPVGFIGHHGKVSAIEIERGELVADQVTNELARFVDDWLARAELPLTPSRR
jgi:creatinine amidohydrolase